MNADPTFFPGGLYRCDHCKDGVMVHVENGLYPRRVRYVCGRCRHSEWWILTPEEEKPE